MAVKMAIKVFKGYLRRVPADDQEGRAHRREVLGQLRQASYHAAQFANLLLSLNYLKFKFEQRGEIPDSLDKEIKRQYTAWNDRLSAAVRDAVSRSVVGKIRALGRKVMRGDVTLPSYRRRGALLVRGDRGAVQLWQDNGRVFCSLKITPEPPVVLELWVKGLKTSPGYRAVLDRLLDGTYAVKQAQVIFPEQGEVEVRLAYELPVVERTGNKVATLEIEEEALLLRWGQRRALFPHEVGHLARVKRQIEARMAKARREARRTERHGRSRFYQYRVLRRFRRRWYHIQLTWRQQLAARIIRQAEAWGVDEIELPTGGKFAEELNQLLDWSALASTLAAKAQERGLRVSQIPSQEEQEQEGRKQARKQRRSRARTGKEESNDPHQTSDAFRHGPAEPDALDGPGRRAVAGPSGPILVPRP